MDNFGQWLRNMSGERLSDCAYGPDWKKDDGRDQREHAMNRDSEQTEGQQHEPDDWVQKQSRKRQGPAKQEQ